MEIKINLNYEQVLGLIRQLPKEEIEKLAITLQSEISTQKPSTNLEELILEAPTWDDSELEDYQRVRGHINKSRLA